MNLVTSVCDRFSPALSPMNWQSSGLSGFSLRKALFARRASHATLCSGVNVAGSTLRFFLESRASFLAAFAASWVALTASRTRVVNSVESALSCSARLVRRASEVCAGAATVSALLAVAAMVGTTISTLEAVTFSFLALGALAAGAGTGAAATGSAVFFWIFLSAGILFVLETETVEDISNALGMIVTLGGHVNTFNTDTERTELKK